jgi:polyferredoxin
MERKSLSDYQVMKKYLPLLRLGMQGIFMFFCLLVGYRFYRFFLWATSGGDFVPRPPAVEAFLPLGALVSLKRFVLTGHYDRLHPAGLTIFIAALVIALLFRKGFCGWICPVGFIFDLEARLTSKFHKTWHLPGWLENPLRSLKYLLLAFFFYLVVWNMDLRAIDGFTRSPYNLMVDAKMLLFFLHPSAMAIGIIVFLFAVSLLLRNFWCRYLCPYGGLLGLLAMASPFQVKRESSSCIDCKKCEQACPAGIIVTDKETVRDAECVGCMECVVSCPVPDCLTLSLSGRKRMALFWLPLGIIAVFMTFYLVARFSGHWHSAVPVELFKKMYRMAIR